MNWKKQHTLWSLVTLSPFHALTPPNKCPSRRGQHCITCLANLQGSSHEYRAAHEQEDDQASEPLLSDAQEARLLPRSRALRLQLQAVDVRDGQDRGRHEPGQAHDGAHRQHHRHHQQVEVVPTTLLQNRDRQIEGNRAAVLNPTNKSCMIWIFKMFLTSSLCSLRLMMTAVICWSMKIRMVQRRAGIEAAKTVHHGLRPIGLISQPRSSLVGWGKTLQSREVSLWFNHNYN